VVQQKIFNGPCLNWAEPDAVKGAEVSLQQESPAETYTAAEIVEAVKSLNTQHKTALMKLARAYAVKTSFGHEDLLQEAWMRLLDGRREWPRSVGVIPFLAGVMRSIAWDWQVERHDESVDVNEVGYEDQTASAKIDTLRTIALFDDDPIAQKMIIALLDGARGEELRKLSGLTKTEYESKRAKIRRRIEKVWC
jgi:DNA-directed RNA polymerase specialized sigma24 family protein